jgi:hypothetical protein
MPDSTCVIAGANLEVMFPQVGSDCVFLANQSILDPEKSDTGQV